MIRLDAHKTKEGVAYRVGTFRRILLGSVFAFLLWGIVLYLREGDSVRSLSIPIAMAVLCFLAFSYRETWLFLPRERKVVSLFGFGPFVKREEFPYERIERLEITHFVKDTEDPKAKPGRRKQKPMIVFSILLSGQEEKTIEVIPEHTSLGRTESAAQVIAAISGLALMVDRPRDMDISIDRDEFHSFR
jgi:hypothetical protein